MAEGPASVTGECRCGGEEPWDGNYFVAAYPPFSTWTKESAARVRERLATIPSPVSSVPLGLYVHIPFCVKRCDYCYYLSYADKTSAQHEDYGAALTAELRRYADLPLLAGRFPSFVYFGGGTPSLLSNRLLDRLLGELQGILPWDHIEEVTFECAPRTVTEAKLRLLRRLGVTRLSLGAQTFDDDLLCRNGRVHLRADIERAYASIRDVGFDVVNVDLMVGLPGESDRSLDVTLEAVAAMAPECVTIYQTEIPHNTPLHRVVREGILARATGILAPEMLELASPVSAWNLKRARLARAFARLEQAGYTVRSAYAAVRDPQEHRFLYQDEQYRGADLLGLGVASFSYLAGVHHQNHTSFEDYLRAAHSGALPIQRAYELTDDERAVREFVLQLKLGRVAAGYFRDKFGIDVTHRFRAPLARCQEAGWLTADGDAVILTREGLIRADRIIPLFYRPEHADVRYS